MFSFPVLNHCSVFIQRSKHLLLFSLHTFMLGLAKLVLVPFGRGKKKYQYKLQEKCQL